MAQEIPNVLEDVSQQLRTNFMGFASFTVLIWDHIDTFADEVNYIWHGNKGPIVYLFLLNRYLTPLGFMVNLYAYLSPVWTPEMCDRFVRFEGAMTVTGINVAAMMMYLRIYVLYNQNRPVLVGVFLLLLIEFGVNAWLLTHGQRVHHNPASGVVACTMIFSPTIPGWLAASSAWLPLLYDTVILCLTLYRTLPTLKNRRTSFIMRRLFQDGLVYYSAIFAVTLVLVLMIIFAPPGIQNITAQLELLLTVAMMSRITINLKKSVNKARGTAIQPVISSFLIKSKSTRDPESGLQFVTPGRRNGKSRAGPLETALSDDDDVYDPAASYPVIKFASRLSTIAEASTHFGTATVQSVRSAGGGARNIPIELDTLEERSERSASVRNEGKG